MAEQHRIFLAVPGPQICWGTLTGVVHSTRKHIAYPHNGGIGFSGVEDFNILWAEAINDYERGEITHFAMLHGDITPSMDAPWLDVLLEEMDARGAALVSAVSPIKDSRGVTSSGIADLDDPWRPWRRFTIREILQHFPETFSAADLGYPDRPLLHNTGLWVCDLRRPEFRRTRANELDLYFRFPTRAVRGEQGFIHQRESEDWAFSVDLWLRGIRDTYITRRIKLTHHGRADFVNHAPWGDFLEGDENTADKWRAEREKLPLYPLQLLNFELHPECNLGECHAWRCPNRSPERWASGVRQSPMTDDLIIAAAVAAYRQCGFNGLVGWAYYNEPLIQEGRMFALMDAIRARVPEARFILWTNGTLIPEMCWRYGQFSQIMVSNYGEESARGIARLKTAGIECFELPADLDDRLEKRDPPDNAQEPCLRPFVELAFDAYGSAHLCCYDWRGEFLLGNLHQQSFQTIAEAWRTAARKIAGETMADDAPEVCRRCARRWSRHQQHDAAIVARARRLRTKGGL